MSSLPADLPLNSLETSQIVHPFHENTHSYMQHSDFSSRSVSTTSSVYTSPLLGGSTYPTIKLLTPGIPIPSPLPRLLPTYRCIPLSPKRGRSGLWVSRKEDEDEDYSLIDDMRRGEY